MKLKPKHIIWISVGVSALLVGVGLYMFGGKLLSYQQERYIKNLNSKVRRKFRKLINRIQKETGYKVIITSGYRDFAHQERLKRENSKNAKAGFSEHNYGIALDFVAIKGTHRLRKSTSKREWEQTGIPQIAKSMGFRWGGDFKGYHDPVHFGLGHIYDTSKLKEKAHSKFGYNNSNIKGNQIRLT